MKKSRFSKQLTIGILKQHAAGMAAAELCRKHGISDAVSPADTLVRRHAPARRFAARIGGKYDPLTLDGYAPHWKEKRHLTSMPNEAAFDPVHGQLTTGEWIQRLVETVEIHAVLIDALNKALKQKAAPLATPS